GCVTASAMPCGQARYVRPRPRPMHRRRQRCIGGDLAIRLRSTAAPAGRPLPGRPVVIAAYRRVLFPGTARGFALGLLELLPDIFPAACEAFDFVLALAGFDEALL